MSPLNTVFSAGLGRGGRLAAWAVGIAGAVRELDYRTEYILMCQQANVGSLQLCYNLQKVTGTTNLIIVAS
jgi:hypothetical protein